MKRTFVLVHDVARQRAAQFVREAPHGYCVTISEPTRSLEQNSILWPLLGALAAQVEWHGMRLSSHDWKDLLTASLTKQRSAPAIDGGGFVVFGHRTSQYSKSTMSDLIELIHAFGAQHNVNFGNNQ